jgi:hypothetical protein
MNEKTWNIVKKEMREREREREREKKMSTCKMTRKRKERTMKTFVCLS